jgi:hypothetical protein
MKPIASRNEPLVERLEDRLLCRLSANGEFVIAPPGGGEAHETIKLQPSEGVIGLNIAETSSNGVVNWQKTAEHEWTPGDPGGPLQLE